METLQANEVQKAVKIFEDNGIKARLNNDGMIIISHYSQPKEKTFSELGINEDELIKHVIGCEGIFDTRNSELTTFPLVVSQEIRLYEDTKIVEMPNLKAVEVMVTNTVLKKLPKLKAAGSIAFESSPVKALPKLRDIGILIIQNSKIKDLSSLERAQKLCIIDTPIEDLKNLEEAKDIFICSSDPENKIDIVSLPSLEEVEQLFVANANLKALPKLKKAKKIALYNCEIKSVKASIGAEVEIQKEITDEELNNKFDAFTDWYNSDILQQSMDLLGGVVNQIKS